MASAVGRVEGFLHHRASVAAHLFAIELEEPTRVPASVVSAIVGALPAGATVLDVLAGCAVVALSFSRAPISVCRARWLWCVVEIEWM